MNKVILLGNLGKNAERRTTQSGKTITTFNIGTSKVWKDSNGEKRESTEWHNIEYWSASDRLFNCLNKGVKILIEGELKYGEYEKDGVKHKTTKVVCSNLELAGRSNTSTASNVSPPLKMKEDIFIDDDIPF